MTRDCCLLQCLCLTSTFCGRWDVAGDDRLHEMLWRAAAVPYMKIDVTPWRCILPSGVALG